MNISFKTLRESCKYQGAIKDGVKMCSFKNGKVANCWDDWQECKEKNCCLIYPKLKEPIDDQLEGQMSIEDFLGGG